VIGDMADWNRDRAEEMRVRASRTPAEAGHRAFHEHAAWRLLTIQQDDQAGGNRPLTLHEDAAPPSQLCRYVSQMRLWVVAGIRALTFSMPCSRVSSDCVAVRPVTAGQAKYGV
jgi:hypothetical protein